MSFLSCLKFVWLVKLTARKELYSEMLLSGWNCSWQLMQQILSEKYLSWLLFLLPPQWILHLFHWKRLNFEKISDGCYGPSFSSLSLVGRNTQQFDQKIRPLSLETFRRSYRDPSHPDLPLQHWPTRTPPPGPDLDLFSTRFRPGPEKRDFRSKSGRNRIKIGSKSGPGRGVQLGRRRRGRSGWEGPCSSSESLYLSWEKANQGLSHFFSGRSWLCPRPLWECSK